MFRDLKVEESDAFAAERYRFEGLALHAEKTEANRRVESYGDAVATLAVCPLRRQAGVRRMLMPCIQHCRL